MFSRWTGGDRRCSSHSRRQAARARLRVELLEDRCTPALAGSDAWSGLGDAQTLAAYESSYYWEWEDGWYYEETYWSEPADDWYTPSNAAAAVIPEFVVDTPVVASAAGSREQSSSAPMNSGAQAIVSRSAATEVIEEEVVEEWVYEEYYYDYLPAESLIIPMSAADGTAVLVAEATETAAKQVVAERNAVVERTAAASREAVPVASALPNMNEQEPIALPAGSHLLALADLGGAGAMRGRFLPADQPELVPAASARAAVRTPRQAGTPDWSSLLHDGNAALGQQLQPQYASMSGVLDLLPGASASETNLGERLWTWGRTALGANLLLAGLYYYVLRQRGANQPGDRLPGSTWRLPRHRAPGRRV